MHRRFLLLAGVVASAHAFIGSFAAVAAIAGFNLDGIEGAVIGITAMVFAALYTAADIVVRILLRHNIAPPVCLPVGRYSISGCKNNMQC